MNADVANYLNRLDFDVTFRGKDGRRGMLERVLRCLDRLSPAEQKSIRQSIIKVLPKSETSGWFDAIRGEL